MQNKKTYSVIIVVALLAVVAALLIGKKANAPSSSENTSQSEKNISLPQNKLQQCPSEWVNNAMPGIDDKSVEPKEYFILNGQRRELDEFDLDWVRKNCNLQKHTVF
ncbi:MAG TPA: hypothetical protein VF817_01790 [Patescibacteria group bacterium]